MSKTSGKSEVDDVFTSYIQMKSPLMGSFKFDVSLPPPPADPKLLDYEINKEIIDYELTALELSERLSSFHDFSNGISDDLLEGIPHTGCGIENSQLLLSLSSCNNSDIGPELLKSLEALQMPKMLSRAKDGLPPDIQDLLSTNVNIGYIEPKQNIIIRSDTNTHSNLDRTKSLEEAWAKMTIDEKINVYMDTLEKTFVEASKLKHPSNKNSKIVNSYKVLPNLHLWSNEYIQVGLDDAGSKRDVHSTQLEANNILKIAKESQTHRTYEYYKKSVDDTNDFDELFNDEEDTTEEETFKFVRQYNYQKPARTNGNENYYLLSIPHTVHESIKTRLETGDDNIVSKEDKGSVVLIAPIKGHKFVFTKAGATKRPNLQISYTTD